MLVGFLLVVMLLLWRNRQVRVWRRFIFLCIAIYESKRLPLPSWFLEWCGDELAEMMCLHPEWWEGFNPEDELDVAHHQEIIEEFRQRQKLKELKRALWMPYLLHLLGLDKSDGNGG